MPPCHEFFIEFLNHGSIVDKFDVFEKGAYMFGRVDLCDLILEHPTVSRFHAVLQFKRNGEAFLYDVGSTHGTFINESQVEKRVYFPLLVGDVFRFGHSSRLHMFQGPPELMPPEVDRKILKEAKIRQEVLDKEASLQRARLEASLTDGISWGKGEDAIEEAEDDGGEVTWQNYKGQLTEKQEKTRDKIIKRTEKITRMRKEIDSFRAQDIAQGGLTQGQQIWIACNEQRITQMMEELENLEETLSGSIRESIGARSGRMSLGKRKRTTEDDEEFFSDDDEFYDTTNKLVVQKVGEKQSIEGADTLLDEREAIIEEADESFEIDSKEENDGEDFCDDLATEAIIPPNGDIWESKSSNKFGKTKWRLFEYVIGMSFFNCLDPRFFLPGLNPCSERWFNALKNGFYVRTIPLTRKERVCFSIEGRAVEAAKYALAFHKEWKGEKSLEFVELCYLNAGRHHETEKKEIFYITFAAIDQNSGSRTEFQASVYLFRDRNLHYLKAFRPKPEGLKLEPFIV